MSVKGKRVIYVGPADGANSKPLNVEGIATQADILPGMVVESVAGGLQKNAAIATVFGEILLVADKDQQRSRSVDDVWTLDDSMVAIQPRSGEFVNVLVLTGQALINGTALTRSGTPGALIIAATDGTVEIVAFASEVVTTTGTQLVCVRMA